MKRSLVFFALVASTAFGDEITIGPAGIDSKATGLDGSSPFDPGAIEIGMAENERSGKAGYDSPDFRASNTEPFGVYRNTTGTTAGVNQFVGDHATEVAGVMIGKAQPFPHYEGVAPAARLHSIAFADGGDPHSVFHSIVWPR